MKSWSKILREFFIYSSALSKTRVHTHTVISELFRLYVFFLKTVSGRYSGTSKTVYYKVLQTWKLFPTVLRKFILQQFIHSYSSPTPSRYKEIYVTSFNIFEDHHQFANLCHIVLSNYKASVKLKIITKMNDFNCKNKQKKQHPLPFACWDSNVIPIICSAASQRMYHQSQADTSICPGCCCFHCFIMP